jgi:hypothetical protein
VVDQLVRDPLAWHDRELTTLVCGVRQAAQAGLAELCWGLASSTVTLFDSRTYLDDWQETHAVLPTCRMPGSALLRKHQCPGSGGQP